MIPYINRTCDVVLSDLLDHKDIRVREIINELQSQFDNYTELLEAVVFMAPGRFRLTCKSSRKMENLEHTGFHIRGHPVEFVPVTKFKWVNISRLSYGVPDTDISKVLGAYGQIKTVRSEQYNSLYTGVRHVLMDLSADIPARLRIAGHWCFVHYKGQKKLCFSCGSEGHTLSTCPSRAVRPSASDVPPAGDTVVSTVIPGATVSVVAPVNTSTPPTITADAGSSNHHTAEASSAVLPLREPAGDLVAPPTDPVELAVDYILTTVVLGGEGSVTTVGAVAPLEVTVDAVSTAVVLHGEGSVTTVGAVAPLEVAVDDVSTNVGLDGNGSVTTVGALSGRSKRPRSRSNSRSPPKTGKNELPPLPDSDMESDSESQTAVVRRISTSAPLEASPPRGDTIPPAVVDPPTYDGSSDDGQSGLDHRDSPSDHEHELSVTDIEHSDSPLSIIPPNLPCAYKVVSHPTSPEPSQVSEESAVIARFFHRATISTQHSSDAAEDASASDC